MSEFDDIPDSTQRASRSGSARRNANRVGDVGQSPTYSAARWARPISAPPTSSGALGTGGFLVARRVSPLLLPGYSRVAALVDLIVFSASIIILALVAHVSLSAAELPAASDSAEHVDSESYEQSNEGSEQGTSADTDRPGEAMFNLALTILFGLGGAGFVLLLLVVRRQRFATIGLTARNLGYELLWGLVVVPAAFAAHFLGVFTTMLLLPGAMEELADNAQQIKAFIPTVSWPYYLLMFTCVGFYEEVVFRGLILTRIRCLVGNWWVAVPLAALAFAVPHLSMQNAAALPSVFALGCVLSVFTIWRRSLIPAMVAHGLFNSIQLVVLNWLMSQQPELLAGVMG